MRRGRPVVVPYSRPTCGQLVSQAGLLVSYGSLWVTLFGCSLLPLCPLSPPVVAFVFVVMFVWAILQQLLPASSACCSCHSHSPTHLTQVLCQLAVDLGGVGASAHARGVRLDHADERGVLVGREAQAGGDAAH